MIKCSLFRREYHGGRPIITFHNTRRSTKRYPLIEIIFLIISATISGCEGWKSIRDFGLLKLEWLRHFLPYENGIPVDDTIARVMRKLNTKPAWSDFSYNDPC